MAPNMTFERDVPKAARPSTLRWKYKEFMVSTLKRRRVFAISALVVLAVISYEGMQAFKHLSDLKSAIEDVSSREALKEKINQAKIGILNFLDITIQTILKYLEAAAEFLYGISEYLPVILGYLVPMATFYMCFRAVILLSASEFSLNHTYDRGDCWVTEKRTYRDDDRGGQGAFFILLSGVLLIVTIIYYPVYSLRLTILLYIISISLGFLFRKNEKNNVIKDSNPEFYRADEYKKKEDEIIANIQKEVGVSFFKNVVQNMQHNDQKLLSDTIKKIAREENKKERNKIEESLCDFLNSLKKQ